MKKKAKKAAKTAKKTGAKPARASEPVNKSGIMPLGDKVLVRPLSEEEMGTTTSFGIIIPETVDKTKPNRGIVVAVGTGKRGENGERLQFDVKVGDRVYFTKPWSEPEKINGVEYYFVSESEILAILK
ncbi:MAG TPA: co-chaperone GroES [Candidatus Paceibacterota bacterium]|nr:co-chaperone GroES [Candidatus Paceibacterota bacterium]